MSQAYDEPEQEEKLCLHCGELLPVSEMEPLETGEPSNMCKREYEEYVEKERAELPERIRLWRQRVKEEEAEGERREIERKLSKGEKEKARVAKHSLRLVE